MRNIILIIALLFVVQTQAQDLQSYIQVAVKKQSGDRGF